MTDPRRPRKRKVDLPTTDVRGEYFVHRYLWLGYEHLAAEGTEPRNGSAFANVAALLMLYFAFEGYLNCVGEQACTEVWRGERAFFASGRYTGTLGKLDYLAEHLAVSLDRARRPYQTLRELEQRRDSLVHPRVEEILRTVRLPNPEYRPPINPRVFSVAEPAFVRRAGIDVEAVADAIQAAALKRLGSEVIYGDRAFRGSTGYQTSWMPPPID